MHRKFISILLIPILLGSCSGNNQSENLIPLSPLEVNTLSLPSSNTHNPNSTWWGYHMSKLARDGQFVYVGIIENDTENSAITAHYNVYKVGSDGNRTLVGSHSASRPGNLLITSDGALHVFVFQPLDASINDSVGNLVYYHYPDARADLFTTVTSETIQSSPSPVQESVNIRIGATLNANNVLAVGYGLNFEASTASKAMVVFTKTPGQTWQKRIYSNLAHEYYYPFLALTGSNRIFVLPVQDDFVQASPPFNRYYKSPLLLFDGTSWSQQMIIDLSTHPSAIGDQNKQLVEQSELLETASGNVMAIVIDKSNGFDDFKFTRVTFDSTGNQIASDNLDWASGKSLRWIRSFEIDSGLYDLGLSNTGRVYLHRAASNQTVRIELSGMNGAYIYLSSGRGGSHQNHDTLDLLAIPGNSGSYPSPGMKLHLISKSKIKALF